ncbi:septin-9- hypothetical protein [Limosa lapponica baueri]|uniref:Septin-9 n=1 Tax=Limosa lapponica baueri TaxID=1758121 RepID=A0A2I0TH65_LIMLA|nr:septin-9- hypothetical protein [Limosa lapponica baueri]
MLRLLFTPSSSGTHQASPEAGSTGWSGVCKTICVILLPSGHKVAVVLFPSALKRSFEVEEVDQSSNSSTPQRRTPNTLLRSTVSSSTQKFQELGARNSEPSARHVDPTSQRSPKPSLRRVELSGPKLAEPVSRRTEISIDISSKQVENSTSGLSRFGLKRADVLGHKPPEPTPRRTEITLGKPQEPGLRRVEAPASKIPEMPQRRAETANAPVPDTATKRVEIQVAKAAEVPGPPARQAESSEPPLAPQPPQAEPKPPPVLMESPPKREEGPMHLWSHHMPPSENVGSLMPAAEKTYGVKSCSLLLLPGFGAPKRYSYGTGHPSIPLAGGSLEQTDRQENGDYLGVVQICPGKKE